MTFIRMWNIFSVGIYLETQLMTINDASQAQISLFPNNNHTAEDCNVLNNNNCVVKQIYG